MELEALGQSKAINPKRPIMLVFEGPECAGKSTQIQLLAEEFSCSIHKRVKTPGEFQRLAAVVNDIQQQALRTSGVSTPEALVLFDRWQLISDVVYEKHCFKSKSIFEPLLPMFGRALRDANILVIYLNIDESEMVKRFRIRGDKLRTLDEAIKVRNAYEDFFMLCDLPYEEINVAGMTIDQINKKIKELAGLSVYL